jgi:hypothetical protein
MGVCLGPPLDLSRSLFFPFAVDEDCTGVVVDTGAGSPLGPLILGPEVGVVSLGNAECEGVETVTEGNEYG